MSRRAALVLTHRHPKETACALDSLRAAAARHDYQLCFNPDETAKHGLSDAEGLIVDCTPGDPDIHLCIVLGGDGTILSALRHFAYTEVPVFAVNFGEVGFLATIEREEMDQQFDRAFSHEFEILKLPGVVFERPEGKYTAMNDVSIHRKVGERVAQLGYAIEREEVGSVRCDGVVVATPAGSTGYNLANGGPVLAWGVEGYVVSFIAPHSLTARALVVAPLDVLTLQNRSGDVVDITVDGRPIGELGSQEAVDVRFEHDVARLAQVPGSSFYKRLREKFGRLSW